MAGSSDGRFLRRVERELRQAKGSKVFKLAYDESDLNKMFFIFSPINEDSLYFGRQYVVEADLHQGKPQHEFPVAPPTCKFLTPVWHPNVGPTGSICLDVLSYEWSSMTTFEGIVQYILQLLDHPNPHSILTKVEDNTPEHKRQIIQQMYEAYHRDRTISQKIKWVMENIRN